MIINRYISLLITICFFLFLMLLASSAVMTFLPGSLSTAVGVVLIIVFFVLSRSFYYYLRSDEVFRNTRKRSSDRPGERYIVKGETDIRKIFLIVWIIVMFVILSAAMIFVR